MNSEQLGQLLSEASEHEGAARWSEAAFCYARLADVLEGPSQIQALLSAGDCLRRGDRPGPAVRLLRDAYQLSEAGGRSLIGVQLAGVLHAIGELPAACDLARAAVAGAEDERSLIPSLDTLMGTLMALGELEEARACLSRLRQVASGPLSPVPFHEATFLRLAGDFDGAAHRYQGVLDTLGGHDRVAGAAAVALSSLGETALFQQDPERARSQYAAATEHWLRTGRRGGLYRSEAGELRASLMAGAIPLTAGLDERIRFAESRQLRLLESHLLIIQAGIRHRSGRDGVPSLERAAELAHASAARFLEGRARLGLRAVGAPVSSERLRHLLRGDQGWLAVVDGRLPMIW